LKLSDNYGYYENYEINLFMCSNSSLLIWNKLFWEFCLTVWKPWILLMIIAQTCFKSLVESLGIFEYWWVMNCWCWLWRFGVFVKNKHDCENLINWWYDPCLMCFNCSFWLCYLLMKFVQRFLVNWDQKWDFLGVLVWVPEREPIFWISCSC